MVQERGGYEHTHTHTHPILQYRHFHTDLTETKENQLRIYIENKNLMPNNLVEKLLKHDIKSQIDFYSVLVDIFNVFKLAKNSFFSVELAMISQKLKNG